VGALGQLARRVAAMSLRFERKLPLRLEEGFFVVPHLLAHPLAFREAYPDRVVRNLYFDTEDLRAFALHLSGAPARAKWRLRAYDTEAWRVLEEKRKSGEFGEKLYHDPRAALAALATNSSFDHGAHRLRASLENSYLRSYWQSSCGRIRVTLDRELRYRSPGEALWAHDSGVAALLEVKYALMDAQLGETFLKSLPFRVQRFSKYVRGVQLCR